ncbi:3 beta-hydroxysteroid dehydrogenase type 7 [Lampetra fluviatilis]
MARDGQVFVVLGGSGFLGEWVVRLLLEKIGDSLSEVRVFDSVVRDDMRAWTSGPCKLTLIKGDITDYEQLAAVVRGAHAVIHSISIIDFMNIVPKERMQRVNVGGTQNVVRACVQESVPILVYTSSTEVVGPNKRFDPFFRGNEDTPYKVSHNNLYSSTKCEAEKIVLSANGTKLIAGGKLSTCAIRPSGIYGEKHDSLEQAYRRAQKKSGVVIRVSPTNSEHGRVYVGNVAWMHVMAAQALEKKPQTVGGQVYYSCDESPFMSYTDFNMEFFSELGFRVSGERMILPYYVFYLLAILQEVLQVVLGPLTGFKPFLNRYMLNSLISTFTVSSDKASRHFNYEPLYSWAECRQRTVAWLRALPVAATPTPPH